VNRRTGALSTVISASRSPQGRNDRVFVVFAEVAPTRRISSWREESDPRLPMGIHANPSACKWVTLRFAKHRREALRSSVARSTTPGSGGAPPISQSGSQSRQSTWHQSRVRAVRSKSGVNAFLVLDSLLCESRETRVNIGEEDGRHEGSRTPDLYLRNLDKGWLWFTLETVPSSVTAGSRVPPRPRAPANRSLTKWQVLVGPRKYGFCADGRLLTASFLFPKGFARRSNFS
jgi:hypothetical protein